MNPLRRPGTWVVLVLAVLAGGLREFVVLNLNYQIDHVRRGTRFSYAHSTVQHWMEGVGLSQLVAYKWLAAAFFVGICLVLTLAMDRVVRGDRGGTRPILLLFLGCSALVLLLHATSVAVPALERVALQLLHALQYQVPVLFVLLAAWLPSKK